MRRRESIALPGLRRMETFRMSTEAFADPFLNALAWPAHLPGVSRLVTRTAAAGPGSACHAIAFPPVN